MAMATLVMAGHSRSKNGVASARLRPGHPRLTYSAATKDVDARHKAGHDEESLRLQGTHESLLTLHQF
jgi:hypothetical protein